MFGFGIQEMVIIAGIAMLFFGGKKLPEFARGAGQAIREFKSNLAGISAQPKPLEALPATAQSFAAKGKSNDKA